jgi:putative MATE family efflux protein
MAIDASTLTRNLKPLVAAGLISVAPGSDGRSHAVAITESGRSKRNDAQRHWKAAQDGLDAAGVEDVAAMHALIDRCLERFSRSMQATCMSATPNALDPRTRLLLEAPIVPTLLRLAAPNVLIMLAQASAGLIETFFVGKLGTDALAGMALVFPVVMLMQTISAGAFGGAISSTIARALGSGRRADADALVLHSLAIAIGMGLLFMVAVLIGGRGLFGLMGARGGALRAAMIYSNLVFGGAVLVWVFNSLGAVIRGTGNMALPAIVTCAGTVMLIPLSPLLIFGWGRMPPLGIAGGAVALLLYYLLGSIALAAYLWSRKSLLRPSFANIRFRWAQFRDILRLGLVGTISAAATNLTIGITTALVGGFGTAAIAGYGTASRLEYLLIPLVFGLGSPLVAIVGTCMGAGLLRARCRRPGSARRLP